MRHMAPALLIFEDKSVLPDGSIIQMRIWRLPVADAERGHGLKYSLFYGRPGERIIGYDNERGKGDHKHYRSKEEPYVFVSVEQLVSDFLSDVRKEQQRWHPGP